MKSSPELSDAFRAEGFKITPQRQTIFGVLDRLRGTHPTAEVVYDQVVQELPTVSLKTVYQTLNELVAMGELSQIDLGTGSSRFDSTLGAHHHLVCTECGAVFDVHASFSDVSVPSGIDDRFEVTATEITFRGRCGACATASVE